MTIAPEHPAGDKVTRRRLELAESALKTIGELGYARSSLREIAANSDFSHGVVHYYFNDKIELIAFCVRVYKTACSKRYDDIVASATSTPELLDGVLAAMSATLVEDLGLHRLWYDLRTQSMFEPLLRDDVGAIDALLEEMTWRIVSRYAELSDSVPLLDAPSTYAVVDGVFAQAVLACADDPQAASTRLADRVRSTLTQVVNN